MYGASIELIQSCLIVSSAITERNPLPRTLSNEQNCQDSFDTGPLHNLGDTMVIERYRSEKEQSVELE